MTSTPPITGRAGGQPVSRAPMRFTRCTASMNTALTRPKTRPARAILRISHGVQVDRAELGRRRVVDAEAPHDEVADQRAGERRHERLVAHPADALDLEAEHGAGEGHPEHGTEAGGDAGDEQRASLGPRQVQHPGGVVGEAGRHLDGGALPSGRPAEEVGGDGGDEHQRGHAAGDAGAGLVDLVDDEDVALDRAAARVVVEAAHGEATDGEQVEQPAVLGEAPGRPLEHLQEERRRQPGQHAHADAEDDPAQQPQDQAALLVGAACETTEGATAPGLPARVGGFGDLGHGASGGSAPAGGPYGSYRRAR